MYYVIAQPKFKPITTTASWYGGKTDGLVGKLTASGEPLDDKAMTCAMPAGIPLGTKVRVTLGNKYVICRVNDRGPCQRRHPDRQIDLTKAAFSKLAHPDAGLLKGVKVEIISIPKSKRRRSTKGSG